MPLQATPPNARSGADFSGGRLRGSRLPPRNMTFEQRMQPVSPPRRMGQHQAAAVRDDSDIDNLDSDTTNELDPNDISSDDNFGGLLGDSSSSDLENGGPGINQEASGLEHTNQGESNLLEPSDEDLAHAIEADGDATHDEVVMEGDPSFDTTGLKEIGNLASWTVSTCKPGCGVQALRDDDTNLFWQSDGPQPHHINIHFSRFVSIISIRIFLDFESDESYTPTRIVLLAGTGYHDLIAFSTLEFQQPKGWIDVPLEGVGGGSDGNTLRAFLVQVKIVENHQNGKDTHVRGLKIYGRDEKASRALGGLSDIGINERPAASRAPMLPEKRSVLVEPDWMGEAELR